MAYGVNSIGHVIRKPSSRALVNFDENVTFIVFLEVPWVIWVDENVHYSRGLPAIIINIIINIIIIINNMT